MPIELEQQPLNESPPSLIEEIVRKSERDVVVRVKTTFKDPEQFDHFRQNSSNIITDLNSAKARFGVNQERTTPFSINGNIIRYEARLYPFIEQYVPQGWNFGSMFKRGMEVGKLYAFLPENVLGLDDLVALFDNVPKGQREVIVPQGSRVNIDGTISLPLDKKIFVPRTTRYDERVLGYIMDKRISRAKTISHQEAVDVESLLVPANEGLITRTAIFAGRYEVLITDTDHSDAKVRSKHSDDFFYIEFLGSDESVTKEYSNVKLINPGKRPAKKVYLPGLSLSRMDDLDEHMHPERITELSHQREKLAVTLLSDSQPPGMVVTDSTFAYGFSELEKQISSAGQGTVFVRKFPSKLEMAHFEVMASRGELKALVFKKAPRYDVFFKSSDLERLKAIREQGAQVLWYNPDLHDGEVQIYHDDFFMPIDLVPKYDEIFNTGKVMVIYGSGGAGTKVEDDSLKLMFDCIDAFAEFHGSNIGVITGGGPNVMEAANTYARENGHLSGSVHWNIPTEKVNEGTDFRAYFDDGDLQARQDLLAKKSDIGIYGRGGMGTTYEAGIEAVPIKLGMGEKPLFFLGTKFWSAYRNHIDSMIMDGRLDEGIHDHMFFIDQKDEFSKHLSNYFFIKNGYVQLPHKE